MSLATQSPLIRKTLSTLRRRVVGAQLLQGLTVLVLTLVFVHLAFFALSLWAGVSSLDLRIALTGFAALALGLLAWMTHRVLARRLDDRALAALLERRFPELEEKLLTSVEPGQGAAPFIARLAEATDRQLADLDPRRAYSLHRTARGSILAACVLLGAVVLLAASPRYARFCERFFGAWSGPCVGYRLEVLPGDGWTARDRAATVEARLILDDPDETLPADCFLIVLGADGNVQRTRTDRASADTFLFSWPNLREDVR